MAKLAHTESSECVQHTSYASWWSLEPEKRIEVLSSVSLFQRTTPSSTKEYLDGCCIASMRSSNQTPQRNGLASVFQF